MSVSQTQALPRARRTADHDHACNLLSYQRQQEESALDRAGVKFLTATGQSAKGMYETFKRFTNDSLFSAHGADPYDPVAPDASRTRRRTGRTRPLQSLLGQEG